MTKTKQSTETNNMLELFYDNKNKYEICIDEVGRGCLFGRTYIACVILPKDGSFCGNDIKDSKKFHSKIKIKNVSEYIQKNAIYYCIEYIESNVVDEINILQAVMRGMHQCIRNALEFLFTNKLINNTNEILAVIDGNYFKPYFYFDESKDELLQIQSITIEKGDAKYMGIASASILAKVARDDYIISLCDEDNSLVEKYGLNTNMGYGTKTHIDGIIKYGITVLHRKTFGICKNYSV